MGWLKKAADKVADAAETVVVGNSERDLQELERQRREQGGGSK